MASPDRELGVAESAAGQLVASGSVNSTNTALKFLMVGPTAQSQRMVGLGSDVFEALVLSIADLPARWIDYTAIDAIALSPQNLNDLAEKRPEVLTAIRRWSRAGGQLWINPVGDNWERIADVERLLELTPLDAADGTVRDADLPRGWKPIEFGERGGPTRITFRHIPTGRTQEFTDPTTIATLRVDPDYSIVSEVEPAPLRADENSNRTNANGEKPATDSTKWYIQRPNGLGYVRAFRRVWDPVGFGISWRMLLGATPYDLSTMPTPLTAAIETTRTWESRHGMTPDSANPDFANLLVPGVGLAPVTEFRVLITVFVLVIGPLNYWLLKRTNRLHLLILTVPLVALALTSGLFAYAMLSDGLSTTVRVRSFTTLDQRRARPRAGRGSRTIPASRPRRSDAAGRRHALPDHPRLERDQRQRVRSARPARWSGRTAISG